MQTLAILVSGGVLLSIFPPTPALALWCLLFLVLVGRGYYRWLDRPVPVPDVSAASASALRSAGLVLLAFFSLYLLCQNAGYLDSTDAEHRYALIEALVERGSVLLQSRLRPGPYYTIYSPGQSLLALPFYWAGKQFQALDYFGLSRELFLFRSVLVYCALISALQIALLYWLARRLYPDPRAAWLVALCTGTGTMILPYAKSFQTENCVGTFLVLILCLCVSARGGRRRPLRLVAIGCCFAVVITIKIETILWLPCVLAYLIVTAPQTRPGNRPAVGRALATLAFTAPPFLAGLAVILAYNRARYGSIFVTGYEEFGYSPRYVLPHLAVVFLSPGKSLLLYNPLLIPALPLLYGFYRRRRAEALLLLSIIAVMSLFYAPWFSPVGDAAWGARFHVSYLGLLCLPLGLLVVENGRRRLKLFFAGCLAASILIQFGAVCTSYIPYFTRLQMEFILSGKGDRFGPELFWNWRLSPLFKLFAEWSRLELDLRHVHYDHAARLLRPAAAGQIGLAVTLLLFSRMSRGRWPCCDPRRWPRNKRQVVIAALAAFAAYNWVLHSTGLTFSLRNQNDEWIHRVQTCDPRHAQRHPHTLNTIRGKLPVRVTLEGAIALPDAAEPAELHARAEHFTVLRLDTRAFFAEEAATSLSATIRPRNGRCTFRAATALIPSRALQLPGVELEWRDAAHSAYQPLSPWALSPE